ncbi:molybdate ABC transporter substrate-binding protein [Bacillus alkalicellulosilyticus]|uniref:molybdate ABC transporter substrate-binding protein n=1 Tax=Alkalihalobacterium alkalicellulosilyticum TaxID=1912214 RepID=UPI000997C6BB|nr:molybdate ABC transporter substrate-binding protein [Bacillus alkalicellulosilyticus]
MNKCLFFITSIILILISGCGAQQEDEIQPKLYVAAASDLLFAFQEIQPLFEEKYNVQLTFSFGSTGQLADQIENGAPFDAFAAANEHFIDQLAEKDLIVEETREIYALGLIGLATLPDSSIEVASIEDLLKDSVKKIAIANPEHAPYGMAAKEALEQAGIWDSIQSRLIFGRNISDTLTLLETGNVEAAIIARSLAHEYINFTYIDQELYTPLHQTVAVINTSENQELAAAFIEFIQNEGRPIMDKYGFLPTEGK